MKAKEAVQKIKNEFNENINSHVFLVETNDIEKCFKDIKEVIKDLLAGQDMTVRNQIENETYLELVILRSDGKVLKTDRIFELQERIKTKPVLSDYMIYIITPAEDMNESASNKLLKIIEEPNQNIIGFLLTQNSDLLLPTIKSRCETITCIYEGEENVLEVTEEVHEIVKKLILAIEEKDHINFYNAKKNDKIKENALIIENLIKDYYNMACNLKKKKNSDDQLIAFIRQRNNFTSLIKKAKYLNTTLNKLSRNMNTDLMLEKMFFDLKEVK